MSLFYEPIYTIHDVNSFIDEAFGGHSYVAPPAVCSGDRHRRSRRNRSFRPRLDMHENVDGTITATLEVPGLKREDISIELHDDCLTVSGERSSPLGTEKPDETTKDISAEGEKYEETHNPSTPSSSYITRERPYGTFSRAISIPKGTKAESINASVADGLLTITFPKNVPEAEPKKIQIE